MADTTPPARDQWLLQRGRDREKPRSLSPQYSYLKSVGSNPINDNVLAPTNVQSQLSSAEMRVMKVNKKKADREEDGKEVFELL